MYPNSVGLWAMHHSCRYPVVLHGGAQAQMPVLFAQMVYVVGELGVDGQPWEKIKTFSLLTRIGTFGFSSLSHVDQNSSLLITV